MRPTQCIKPTSKRGQYSFNKILFNITVQTMPCPVQVTDKQDLLPIKSVSLTEKGVAL